MTKGERSVTDVSTSFFRHTAFALSHLSLQGASTMKNRQMGETAVWRKKLVLTSVLAVLLSLAGAAEPAHATYPGTNDGRLAFGMIVGGNVDVYSVLPNGNDLRRLTTDASFDACASYSPDGKEIAFCSTRSGASE